MQENYRLQLTATAVCWGVMLLFWLMGAHPVSGFLYGLYGALLTVIHDGVKARLSPDAYLACIVWVPVQIVTALVLYLVWRFDMEKTSTEIFIEVVTRVALAIPVGFGVGWLISSPYHDTKAR